MVLLFGRAGVSHGGDHPAPEAPTMTAQPLPALTSGDPSAWDQALYGFLVEKGNRSGSATDPSGATEETAWLG